MNLTHSRALTLRIISRKNERASSLLMDGESPSSGRYHSLQIESEKEGQKRMAWNALTSLSELTKNMASRTELRPLNWRFPVPHPKLRKIANRDSVKSLRWEARVVKDAPSIGRSRAFWKGNKRFRVRAPEENTKEKGKKRGGTPGVRMMCPVSAWWIGAQIFKRTMSATQKILRVCLRIVPGTPWTNKN